MEKIAGNIRQVKERIRAAAIRSGRKPEEITLIAVTKTVSPENIQCALKNGVHQIGENRVQEARTKKEVITNPDVTWHMIGHLQKNKVKYAVRIFDMIHSVDSLELARSIGEQCEKNEREMPVLIQVNTSGEESKFGCVPEEAIPLAEKVSTLPNLDVRGFMTIGKFTRNRDEIRACFRKLREIFEEVKAAAFAGKQMNTLSMGMSGDFEIAIEEGATMVRIGSAIFGARP